MGSSDEMPWTAAGNVGNRVPLLSPDSLNGLTWLAAAICNPAVLSRRGRWASICLPPAARCRHLRISLECPCSCYPYWELAMAVLVGDWGIFAEDPFAASSEGRKRPGAGVCSEGMDRSAKVANGRGCGDSMEGCCKDITPCASPPGAFLGSDGMTSACSSPIPSDAAALPEAFVNQVKTEHYRQLNFQDRSGPLQSHKIYRSPCCWCAVSACQWPDTCTGHEV